MSDQRVVSLHNPIPAVEQHISEGGIINSVFVQQKGYACGESVQLILPMVCRETAAGQALVC